MMVVIRTPRQAHDEMRVLLSLWERDVVLCIGLLEASKHPTDTSPQIRSFQQVQRYKEKVRGTGARPQDRR